MKTMNKNIIIIALFFLFIMIILTGASYAASFTVTASSTSIKVGDTVTITVKADNAAGMYKVSVDDSSVLSISSGAASEFLENSSQKIQYIFFFAFVLTVSPTYNNQLQQIIVLFFRMTISHIP